MTAAANTFTMFFSFEDSKHEEHSSMLKIDKIHSKWGKNVVWDKNVIDLLAIQLKWNFFSWMNAELNGIFIDNSNEDWPMNKLRLLRIADCHFQVEWYNLAIMSSRSRSSRNTIPFGPIKYLSTIKWGFRVFYASARVCVGLCEPKQTRTG